MTPAPASAPSGYSASLGSEIRRSAGTRSAAPAKPIARPTDISTAHSFTTVQNVPWSLVAKSSIPIISAIPTGSFAPDSPFRIVPLRPAISRPPSTENITAGSVGATAAPRIPAVVQSKPNSVWAKTAITPAVANVPTTPSTLIGTIDSRNLGHPTCMPPSKRITTSATTAIRSTSTVDSSDRPGQMSDATAAATRNSAGGGTGKNSVSLWAASAARNAPETTSTTRPKSVSSLTADTLAGDEHVLAGRGRLLRARGARAERVLRLRAAHDRRPPARRRGRGGRRGRGLRRRGPGPVPGGRAAPRPGGRAHARLALGPLRGAARPPALGLRERRARSRPPAGRAVAPRGARARAAAGDVRRLDLAARRDRGQ